MAADNNGMYGDTSSLGFVISRRAAEEFWSRVHLPVDLDDPAGPCWLYSDQARGERGPYGHVRVSIEGHRVFAHRLAFVLTGGVLAAECVLHICDVGNCLSTWHLISSDRAENNRQRDERGRRTPHLPRGSAAAAARLTDRDVAALQRARQLQVPAKTLAQMFTVSPATIYNVWSGRYYSSTGPSASPP